MLREYITSVKIGDWFVLYQMSKNLNRRFFYDFLINLAKEHQCSRKRQLISQAESGETGGLDEPDLAMKTASKSHENMEKSTENLSSKSPNSEELKKSRTLDEPPPLMEGSPRTLKKVHTA